MLKQARYSCNLPLRSNEEDIMQKPGRVFLSTTLSALTILGLVWTGATANAERDREIVNRSKTMVPMPPWPKGDQVGMANTLGPENQ